jgi:antitoxin ParD1/3/4
MIFPSWGEIMPSSYSLGPRFEALVRELVASGRYNNASEVVRDGLRMVENRERRHAERETAVARESAPQDRGTPSDRDEVRTLQSTIERIKNFRRSMPRVALEEILSARHEGHKY